ncbi:MAG: NIPSNAP family protein [Proteobacteria bacterium]|nr:NIPSNAP family protein [Pseudomonadota bacterium]
MSRTIYLHEIIRTVPGREEPYMASVLSVTSGPGRDRRDDYHRQLGQWRSVNGSGPWHGVINIWQHTWKSQAEALSRQFMDAQRDAYMEDWWQRNLHLRRGGYDRLLVPTPATLDADGLARTGVRGRVFLHEIFWLPFGRRDEFLARFESDFLPAARRYDGQLVGAYSVAMRPRQALTLFAFRDWADLARLLKARHTDPEVRNWWEYREQVVERVDELTLLPGRLNPLGIKD